MQAVEGAKVDYKDDFSNVRPGDLLFFGEKKISHVAISLGGKDYIHQSGDVHINSFDPNTQNYNEKNHKKLKAVRRFF
ncbi:MAG: NlpC/P60 family protein [Planctomycetes bacterium ADurb.Bin401]|nr:MAG: NlpC/P60 family protein [Planctomycetes bacterium ADurb.Bin401]